MPPNEDASTGFTSFPHRCQTGTARAYEYCVKKFGGAPSGCLSETSRLSGGGWSWHKYGKAFDVGFDFYDRMNTGDDVDGMRMYDFVLANKERFGLQQMIAAHKIWDVSYGHTRYYRGNDHMNHVHVAMSYAASQLWTPPDAPPPPAKRKVPYPMNFIQVSGIAAIAVTNGQTKHIFDTPHEFATCQWLAGVNGLAINVTFVDKAYWDSLASV